MQDMFRIEPAYATAPGVTVTEDGVIFAAVFREALPCGVILYHISDGSTVKIPFPAQSRLGSLYSIHIHGMDPGEWGYRLYSDGKTFVDPSSRVLLTVNSEQEEITVGGFYFRPDDHLIHYSGDKVRPWQDEFIYTLHVRGFTMNAPEGVVHPGTFSGVAERIPYLLSLGVTAVELMPVYELQEKDKDSLEPRTMEEALRLYPVTAEGMPVRDLDFVRVNYWGYGRGYYFAPRRSLSSEGYPGGPQKELSDMIGRLHEAGISVYLQLFFTEAESADLQSRIARYYITHYNVDGFHLLGSIGDLREFASDPLLSDTRLIDGRFPYEEIGRRDDYNPESGIVSTKNLADCNAEFSDLIRHFVKSDDYVLHPFLRSFFSVPQGHGKINYVCRSDGFTLRDLVSYNERHNTANGEGGVDGRADNISWNCGEEGETDRKKVLRLRHNQIRNFLTLLFLAQGTPLLNAGDECLNTQGGNNNPYCQDNETGWTTWDDSDEAKKITELVRALTAFRRAHRILRREKPFTGTDSFACGFPDISFHGAEAWKPDFGPVSHSAGVCLCENYCENTKETELLYIAVNMHWTPRPLGLPKIKPRRRWAVVIDTSLEDSFLTEPLIEEEQRFVLVPPRSVKVLCTVKAPKKTRSPRKKKMESVVPETESPRSETKSPLPEAESPLPEAQDPVPEIESPLPASEDAADAIEGADSEAVNTDDAASLETRLLADAAETSYLETRLEAFDPDNSVFETQLLPDATETTVLETQLLPDAMETTVLETQLLPDAMETTYLETKLDAFDTQTMDLRAKLTGHDPKDTDPDDTDPKGKKDDPE